MKRAVVLLLSLLTLLTISSCEKETILTVDQSSLTVGDSAGSQTVSLTANKPWSVTSDQSWCKVSPSAGEEATSSRIMISYDANTSYEARTATVTFTCAELTKTVSVSQATNNGLLVSQTSYDVTKAAQQIEIQVQANVKFSVEVDSGCKDWVKYNTTKGLTTSTVVLDISENKTYDSREGKVTIKQDGGLLSSTVTIKQSQLDGLFLTTSEYNLSNENHTLTVEVKSNIDFEVKSESDWIKYVETKGLKTNQIILDIAANETYDAREGKVIVKQKNGDLSGTITIKQDEKYGLFLSKTEFNLTNRSQKIDVEVKYNVDFEVVIPDGCKEWINQVTTKGLNTKNYSFSIAKNGTYENREGSITFKQKIGDLSATVKITQEPNDEPLAEAVDLGLSVKWSAYNLGANSPEEYGDYFAWGETEPKENYSWSTYKWCNGSQNSLTKYNNDNSYGAVDNKTVLDLADDAARANWGDKWRMPTDAEWTELRTECTWTWTTQNGTKGRLVTGPNGNSIFLPAAGFRADNGLYDAGSFGQFWSSSLNTDYPDIAYLVYFFASDVVGRNNIYRYCGQSVRPVYGDPVSGVSLDRTEITLYAGSSTQLKATILPACASEKGVTWSSNNPSVATVSADGLVTANQAGNAVITVTTVEGGFEATCQVTVKAPSQNEAVDLGLPSGLKWATCNVGANSPEEYGEYFAWGETTPKNDYSWSTYKWCNGSGITLTKYNNRIDFGTVDNKTVLELSDDAAKVKGGNWRMPTDAEWKELKTKCTWTWTTKNGKYGHMVTGPNGNSIFLPAAGYRYDTDLSDEGSYGYYWSSSLDTGYPAHAHHVYFPSEEFFRDYYGIRYCGQSVRPVSE